MNYDLVRLSRIWLGWLVLAVAHQLARLGNLVAGTTEDLVEPVRPALRAVRAAERVDGQA